MKALVITRLAGPEALAVQDVPEPSPKPGQTLVRVAVGGVNFADIMTMARRLPGTPAPPLVAGREFCGTEEDTGLRVMGYAQWGGFAAKVAARRNLLWPVPDHFSDEQGAAFPITFFTAYLAYWQAGMVALP